MRRRLWSSLKPSTKQRYRRAGIHPNTYNAGKADLRAARGHARTPEHPGRGIGRPEFQSYYQQRLPPEEIEVVYAYEPTPGAHSDEVKQAIAQRVFEVFGNRHKYRGRSLDPDFPPLGYPPAPDDDEIMEILALDDYDLEWRVVNDPTCWFLFYH